MNQTLFTLVQLYDNEWPRDLREAGHSEKASQLELFIGKIINSDQFTDLQIEQAESLVDFMRACNRQADGS